MKPLPDTNTQTPASTPSSVTPSDDVTNPVPGVSSAQKEVEVPVPSEMIPVEERLADIELTPELEKIGVEKQTEVIEVPADLQKMGVSATGPAQGHTTSTSVTLPLTDDQIVVGLHAQIISSLRWLAEWCLKKLKQAHIHLKRIKGKIIREKV